MELFRSTKLCYLCQYPVVNGGIRMRNLNHEKLANWWRENLQTEFEYVGMSARSICKFCVWDARYKITHAAAHKFTLVTNFVF